MEIKKNKKGVVIDFQGNTLVSKQKYGVKVTSDDIPLTIKNAIVHNEIAYPIGIPKRIVKMSIVYSIATYIAFKIMEG